MCALDQSTISLITAIGSIFAGAAGLFAAVAAYRSAGIAKEASKHAQAVEHRSLVRDIVVSCQNIIAESMRVDDIANNIKISCKMLGAITDNPSGSRLKLLTHEVEKKQKSIIAPQQESIKTIDKQNELRNLKEIELTEMLIKYEGQLIQIRRIKEKLTQELASINTDIRENNKS